MKMFKDYGLSVTVTSNITFFVDFLNATLNLKTNSYQPFRKPNSDPICGALRDLVAFVLFKKREKHPWKGVNFSKVAGFSLQLY